MRQPAPAGTPTATDRSPSRRVGQLRRLWPFVRRYRLQVAGALLALVIAAGATLAIGQALRRVVDLGFSGQNAAYLDQYFLGLFGVVIVLAAATYGRSLLVNRLGERVIADVRRAVYNHLLELSPSFFEVTRTGEILSRLTADAALIQAIVGSSASVALRNLLLLIGGAVLLVVTSPKLAGLVALIMPVVVLPIIVF
ncbi:MAG: ABC transporter, partial [Alphaproteobacteria bacterium]|nr:ABC transporter [Alphaproteobacteria bacterium]